MKKILVLMLATLVLCVSLVACGKSDNNGGTSSSSEPATSESAPSEKDLAAAASAEEIATALITKYAEYTGTKDTYDQYMAEMSEEDQISYEEFLTQTLYVGPVDLSAGDDLWLQGFTEVPTGFSEAYCYQPMMMGQAFIGYIFRVDENTDVEDFKKTLTDTCDPRWNICTMANTIVCESYGDLVYFSMMVVADKENPNGFTAEQKDGFYNTFIESITGSAE